MFGGVCDTSVYEILVRVLFLTTTNEFSSPKYMIRRYYGWVPIYMIRACPVGELDRRMYPSTRDLLKKKSRELIDLKMPEERVIDSDAR